MFFGWTAEASEISLNGPSSVQLNPPCHQSAHAIESNGLSRIQSSHKQINVKGIGLTASARQILFRMLDPQRHVSSSKKASCALSTSRLNSFVKEEETLTSKKHKAQTQLDTGNH